MKNKKMFYILFIILIGLSVLFLILAQCVDSIPNDVKKQFSHAFGGFAFSALFLHEFQYALYPNKRVKNPVKASYHRKANFEGYRRFCLIHLAVFLILALYGTVYGIKLLIF